MNDKWTVAGFIGAYIAIRIIDALIPGGTHFRLTERWLRRNIDHPSDEDEEQQGEPESDDGK